jgi:hypothetical protein
LEAFPPVAPIDPLKERLRQLSHSLPVILDKSWALAGPHSDREQGWKLHISATIASAMPVLERVLPILIMEEALFKVAATLRVLSDLNEGLAGLSQVGKFITVYPRDDEQALRMAIDLDKATAGMPGPRVPSDLPLRPESLVHYRYGGFSDLTLTDPLGDIVPALRAPTGNLVPDLRLPSFKPPDWVQDPFEAAGILETLPEPNTSLFGGYFILAVLHQHAKGGVYLALDPKTFPPRMIAIKEARRYGLSDISGQDVRVRLHRQFDLLRLLAPDPSLPQAHEIFEMRGNLYLAMEYIEANTLQQFVYEQQNRGLRIPPAQVRSFGMQIADFGSRIHSRGIIVRDLNPNNIMITSDAKVYVIDLEIAHEQNDPRPVFGWGTLGYVSPQQARQELPAPTDDVYAFGATLYFAATGSPPSFLQEGVKPRFLGMSLLNPDIPPPLADAICACMAPDPAQRPQTMTEASQLIAASF